MTIPENKLYPRTGDKETIYLKNAITNPNIIVGDFTMYNDFVNDPTLFEKNNVLYHYPINQDKLVIGKFCSIACGAKFLFVSFFHKFPLFSRLCVMPALKYVSFSLVFALMGRLQGKVFLIQF